MATPSDEHRAPGLASATVVLGFAVIFTTFLTGSAWSWIIGGLLVLAGGLWAGAEVGTGPVAGAEPEQGHGRTA